MKQTVEEGMAARIYAEANTTNRNMLNRTALNPFAVGEGWYMNNAGFTFKSCYQIRRNEQSQAGFPETKRGVIGDNGNNI